ncbi:antitoxin [Agromyces intestinalis]|uniref:Antitoxin n=1 Tax=Agromyces intestinalis TaxID=2592652 RepID=A0A5C1YFA0_9MICO|nr:Rv0909 family putative TA system antitoxin [Agromyces intestinalis]QEO14751.1 antitoxin [Agromyces intestinalis]
MSGLDDLAKQAGDFVEQNKDKIQEVLKSEQAEDISDKVLDSVADAANKVTGGKHADTVKDVRDNIDKSVGNQ